MAGLSNCLNTLLILLFAATGSPACDNCDTTNVYYQQPKDLILVPNV